MSLVNDTLGVLKFRKSLRTWLSNFGFSWQDEGKLSDITTALKAGDKALSVTPDENNVATVLAHRSSTVDCTGLSALQIKVDVPSDSTLGEVTDCGCMVRLTEIADADAETLKGNLTLVFGSADGTVFTADDESMAKGTALVSVWDGYAVAVFGTSES